MNKSQKSYTILVAALLSPLLAAASDIKVTVPDSSEMGGVIPFVIDLSKPKAIKSIKASFDGNPAEYSNIFHIDFISIAKLSKVVGRFRSSSPAGNIKIEVIDVSGIESSEIKNIQNISNPVSFNNHDSLDFVFDKVKVFKTNVTGEINLGIGKPPPDRLFVGTAIHYPMLPSGESKSNKHVKTLLFKYNGEEMFKVFYGQSSPFDPQLSFQFVDEDRSGYVGEVIYEVEGGKQYTKQSETRLK